MKKKQVAKLLGRPLSMDYQGRGLGDERLVSRVRSSVDELEKEPRSGFPKVFGESGSEAFYRLLRNERVDWKELLGFHIDATFERSKHHETVLCLHDTTVFTFGGEGGREDLGWVNSPGSQERSSFLGHVALLTTNQTTPIPLGVAGAELWTRQGKSKDKLIRDRKVYRRSPERESTRWLRLAAQVQEERPQASVIHVMDREAESFELMGKLGSTESRFVLRLRANRLVKDERGNNSEQVLSTLSGLCVRKVALSRRNKNTKSAGPSAQKKHAPRKQRVANLEFSATRLKLKRPKKGVDKSLPLEIQVNVVHVREIDVPIGEKAVDWRLLTSEPIDTAEEVLAVVDIYRKRWLIEEYFQALKTGCAFEKRQLESFKTLSNALALTLPVAWKLLLVRALGREYPDEDGSILLTPEQTKLLRLIAKRPVPEKPTAHQIMWALAGLGGHLRQNGPPGWKTLAAGLQHLLTAETGWNAARQM